MGRHQRVWRDCLSGLCCVIRPPAPALCSRRLSAVIWPPPRCVDCRRERRRTDVNCPVSSSNRRFLYSLNLQLMTTIQFPQDPDCRRVRNAQLAIILFIGTFRVGARLRPFCCRVAAVTRCQRTPKVTFEMSSFPMEMADEICQTSRSLSCRPGGSFTQVAAEIIDSRLQAVDATSL